MDSMCNMNVLVLALCALSVAGMEFEVKHQEHRRLAPAVSAELHITGSSGDWKFNIEGTDDLSNKYLPTIPKVISLPAVIDLILLREGRRYEFTVKGTQNGSTAVKTVCFETPMISLGMSLSQGSIGGVNGLTNETAPDINLQVSKPNLMGPGWTWWSNFPGGLNAHGTFSRLVDEDGVTRWVISCDTLFGSWFPDILAAEAKCGVSGLQIRLKNGNLLLNWNTNYAVISGMGLSGLIEVNLLGEMQHIWVSGILPYNFPTAQLKYMPPGAIRLPVEDINHDVQELPNGHWMLIAYDIREITTAQCTYWTKDQNVTGDVIIEFDPYNNNTVFKKFSTFDALDVCATYPGIGAWPAPEWNHINSFDVHNVFQVDRNELILSSFSQGWVFAVRYADDEDGKAGTLKWIIGRPRPPDTAGPREAEWFAAQNTYDLKNLVNYSNTSTNSNYWMAGQHNANIVSADGNTLLMFDNGAKTGGKSDQGSPSRLLEMDITKRPTASGVDGRGLASITFQYVHNGTEGKGRAPFLGGARKLPNGNYLGNFGALTQPSCDAPCEIDFLTVCMYSEVVEITPQHEIVFAMTVGGKTTNGTCHAWNAYRAERVSKFELNQMVDGVMTVM